MLLRSNKILIMHFGQSIKKQVLSKYFKKYFYIYTEEIQALKYYD